MSRYRLGLALWLFTDLLLFLGTFTLAYFLRVGFILSTDFPFDRFLISALLSAPFFIIVLATTRAFHMTRRQEGMRNGSFVSYASLVAVSLFTLIYYFRFTSFFSRLLLVEAWILLTVTIWLWHILFSAGFRRVLRKSPPAFPVLIVGVTRESRALIARMNRRKSPLTPVCVLDARGISDASVDGVPYGGRLHRLEEVIARHRITHLIHCSDMEQSLNLLSACRSHGISYVVLPSVFGIVGRDEHIETLEDIPVTVVPAKESLWNTFFR